MNNSLLAEWIQDDIIFSFWLCSRCHILIYDAHLLKVFSAVYLHLYTKWNIWEISTAYDEKSPISCLDVVVSEHLCQVQVYVATSNPLVSVDVQVGMRCEPQASKGEKR